MNLCSTEIHCHLLPGVDDGFRNEESSLRAIGRMMEAGTRNIIFTPHMNPDVYPDMDEQKLKDAYQRFSTRLPAGLGSHLAAEYMVVNGFDERVEREPGSLLVFPDNSILIEMSYYFRSPNLEQAVFNLGIAGFRPIIAHPERYLYMSECLADFDKLADMGCRFQMNLMSLTGKYGKVSLKILKYLLKNGMYSFAATDLHSNQQLDTILNARAPFTLRRAFGKAGFDQASCLLLQRIP